MKNNKEIIRENIIWLEAFAGRIGFSQMCIKGITDLYEKDSRHIHRLCRKKFNAVSSGKILLHERFLKKDKAYIYLLVAVLLKARDTLNVYREKGIADKIFYDTMKDITVWSENCRQEKGVMGIENIGWIQNHLNCKLFKLARLQFQPYFFYLPPYVEKRKRQHIDIKPGEKVLNVHIPQGEKLLREECEKSFEMAESFFTDFPYKAFICDSWLLCETNREFMNEKSNILRFAEMFDILGSSDNPKETVKRVFGKEEKDPRLYPENTSLQKQCKAYLLSGGKPGTGFGIIPRE